MVEGQVYFLLAPTVNVVKIGRSIDIERRLQEIRMISPVELELIGVVPGHFPRETAYHREWAHLRRHGEWFEATTELMITLEADALKAAWDRAGPEARKMALERIADDSTRAARG